VIKNADRSHFIVKIIIPNFINIEFLFHIIIRKPAQVSTTHFVSVNINTHTDYGLIECDTV